MFKLVISDDEGKTTVVPLIRDDITIGRKEGNTIRLTDRNVSRFHARVIREEEGFQIEDLGSLCGTKINNQLLRSETGAISAGDKISIGDYSLSIRTDVSEDVPLGQQMGPGDKAGIGKVTPHARLVVILGPKPGHEINLTADLYVIGRSEEANCRILDSSISRAHARLDFEAGEWTISDLDSVNGILVNNLKKDDYVLKPADIIELGNVRFRFVAPGEPYEYDPSAFQSETESHLPSARRSSPKILYGLIIVAVVAVIAIIVGVVLVDSEGEIAGGDQNAKFGQVESNTYESLMERGKDKIQSEDWAKAARLFTLALQKRPSSSAAREMKRLVLKEADAQKAFTAVLAAEQRGDWKNAAISFHAIPRSSHYYDIEQIKAISNNLCMELVQGVKGAIANRDFSKAIQLLDDIGGISEAPRDCRSREKKLWKEVNRKAPSDAGLGPELAELESDKPDGDSQNRSRRTKSRRKNAQNGEVSQGPKKDFVKPANPYDSPSAKAYTPHDPVSEAHAAIRGGNPQKAISVLEKGGNSRPVLILLSKLYMKAGNRFKYESVARKFIRIYPDDPRAEHFRRNLSR